jgi:hypothetical protein
MFNIGIIVESIDENSSNFDFVSWPCHVNQIVQDVDFLLSRDTAWWHGAWCFLNCPLLVIPVNRHVFFQVERSSGLANDACSEELFLVFNAVMIKWSFQVLAAIASEIHFLEFRKYRCPFGDDTSDFDQSIQMNLSQISKGVQDWKLSDSNEDLIMNSMIIGVDFAGDVHCYFIQNWKHQGWFLSQPNCQSWLFATQILKNYFQALLVILAHFMDLLFIIEPIRVAIIFEVPQEIIELPADPLDHVSFLQP